METTFNQRFTELLNHYNLKAREAARLLKMDRQKVEGYLKDQLPRYDSIVSIVTGFPQIDIRWLLTGEGQIFESGSQVMMEAGAPYNKSVDTDLIVRFWETDRQELLDLRKQNKMLLDELLDCKSELKGKQAG